jgi:beta-carotene 3-hydroxylase
MIILGPLVLILSFFGMEFMAWFTHKFVMHGFMWKFHRDHHQVEDRFFERNDVFFMIYAIPSWLLIMLGSMNGYWIPVWIGFGIALYGLAYFLVHDVYIHRRLKWFRDVDHPYFYAIRKAHKVHHKHLGKEHGECFGMLIVPRKFYLEAKKAYLLKKKNK